MASTDDPFDTDPALIPGTKSTDLLAHGLKACTNCGRTKPLDAEYWYRDKHSADGFHNECKECRVNRQASKRKDIDERAMAELLAIQSAAVDALASFGGKRPSSSDIPSEAEVFEEIVAIMGGPSGIARHVYADYIAAQPGSKVRMAFFQLLFKMMNNVDAAGGAERPLDGLDYDTLMTMLTRVIQQGVTNARNSSVAQDGGAKLIQGLSD